MMTESFVNFDEWLETVHEDFKGDILWKMAVYRIALFWFIGNRRDVPPVLAAVALPPASSATAGATITAIPRDPLFLGDLSWFDATKLVADRRTIKLSDQLYQAAGSIDANIAEGYSRSSGKDRARFMEYSLGSARESRDWYYKGRHILSEKVAFHRIQLLTQIIRLLLTMTPKERGRNIREEQAPYYTGPELPLDELLQKAPLP